MVSSLWRAIIYKVDPIYFIDDLIIFNFISFPLTLKKEFHIGKINIERAFKGYKILIFHIMDIENIKQFSLKSYMY